MNPVRIVLGMSRKVGGILKWCRSTIMAGERSQVPGISPSKSAQCYRTLPVSPSTSRSWSRSKGTMSSMAIQGNGRERTEVNIGHQQQMPCRIRPHTCHFANFGISAAKMIEIRTNQQLSSLSITPSPMGVGHFVCSQKNVVSICFNSSMGIL